MFLWPCPYLIKYIKKQRCDLLFNHLLFDILDFFGSFEAVDTFFVAFDLNNLWLLLLLNHLSLQLFRLICKQFILPFIFDEVLTSLVDLRLKSALLKLFKFTVECRRIILLDIDSLGLAQLPQAVMNMIIMWLISFVDLRFKCALFESVGFFLDFLLPYTLLFEFIFFK